MSLDGFIRTRGTAVTFSLPGISYTESTGATTPSTSSVTGYAIEVAGDVKEYSALGLKVENTMTLLFRPDTAGEDPATGSVASWASAGYTVKSTDTLAPFGTALETRVVMSRG